ncbi:Cell division control 48-like protein C [Nymphaea thermarum]|nr:Cell division control 48-like protein C [Nymphaea thermarum]
MGKRMMMDGGRSPSSIQRMLVARLEQYAYNHDMANDDDVLDHLRTSYPEYKRQKLEPFRRYVLPALRRVRSSIAAAGNSPLDEEHDEGGCCSTPASAVAESSRRKNKKKARIDPSEVKLAVREREHLRKRKMALGDNVGDEDDNGEEDDSSSSEEADSSPQFDLMKSMMRSSYGKLMGASATSAKEEMPKLERNLEVVLDVKANVEAVKMEQTGRIGELGVTAAAESNVSNLVVEDGKGMSEREKRGRPNFKDLGGIKDILDELMMEVMIPLFHPQLPEHLGVRPLKGILLHGPPGCGKTKLAHAIANETGVPFYKISATEVVSGISGVSEENIRNLFSKAYRTAPSIVFIDEIDAIASKRDNLQREMERRIVTQLLTCMDEPNHTASSVGQDSDSEASGKNPGYVLVIGATNRPDAVDPALRRPGRFDREICMGVPDENARVEILSVLTTNLRLEGAFDLKKIAKLTPGFVAADLAALANKAGNLAMKRILDKRKLDLSLEQEGKESEEDWWRYPWVPEEMERLSITMADFEEAAAVVQPSSKREGFSAIPEKTWDDVGGMHSLRRDFELYIVGRIKHPEDYEEFGMDLETGFLLYGPPGCGKSLIAMAVANEAGANFIHIKGPEILSKYVGESELAIRTIFRRARTCAPCILFFDEVDALATKRGKDGGWVVERLINQLLIELDGADQRKGVYVVGATNRPDAIDRALLRPGRLGKLMFVPLPSSDERTSILKTLSRKRPISPDVNFDELSEQSENFSGADLAKWVEEAAMAAFEEKQKSEDRIKAGHRWLINKSHFEEALKKVTPSVSEKQRRYYSEISLYFGRG